MTWISLDRAALGLGRPVALAAAGAVALGAASLVGGVVSGRGASALAALDASWLFFAGLAAGSVAVAAAVRVAHGGWAGAVLPIGEAGAGFFGPALAILTFLALAVGARDPAPVAALDAAHLARSAMTPVAAGALVFALGARFVAKARAAAADPSNVRASGVAYLLGVGVGLSLWAVSLAMELPAGPTLTVVPACYLLGAFLSGLAWIALLAAVRDAGGPDVRHDLGKLLFAFATLWMYLLWSLFLPTWYGNVPAETASLLARWSGGYRPLALAVMAAVFAGPFCILFAERHKRGRVPLAVCASAILLGLWAEGFLLVLPSLEPRLDRWGLLVGAGTALGMAGVFLLSIGSGLVPAPSPAASPCARCPAERRDRSKTASPSPNGG